MLLAFDLSSTTGWAVGPAGAARAEHGRFLLSPHLGLGTCFIQVRAGVEDLIKHYWPTFVGFESPLFVNDDYTRMAFGLAAHVESTCADYDIKTKSISVSSARSQILGTTRFGGTNREERRAACKRAVIAWARSQGYEPADDNEADALVLHRYMQEGHHLRRKAA